MNRRAFVTGLGAVFATPLGVEAQQARGVIDVGAGRDGVFAEEGEQRRGQQYDRSASVSPFAVKAAGVAAAPAPQAVRPGPQA